MKKRIISIVLVVLALVLAATPALATSTNPGLYDSTRSVINAFTQKGLYYTDAGTAGSSNQFEKFTLDYNCDNIADGLTINVFVGESNAHMYIWNIVTVDPAKLLQAYMVINDLNANYYWATFVLDTEDNTIQVEYDIPYYTFDGFGPAVCEVVNRLINIVDDEYNTLAALQ